MHAHLRTFLLALALFGPALSAGCGGGGDGGTSPDQPDALAGAALSAAPSAPGGRIEIDGLPEAKTYEIYEVVFLGADGGELFRLPVEEPDGGLPWIQAPFHPLSPLTGGSVSLRVVSAQAQSPDLELALEGLPAAPGRFQQYVDLLRAHIDQRAAVEGTSFDALAAQAAEDVEPRLLPLKFAQIFVDDPGHPHSLARIADGASGYLNAEQRDLLDRMFGACNIDSLVQADIDHLGEPEASGLSWRVTADAAGKSCVSMGPTVATAQQLSDAMQEAWRSRIAVDPSGAPGKMVAGAGLVLGAAALVPATAPVAAVAGAGLFAWQTSRDYKTNTYPSAFVSLDFEIAQPRVPEDDTSFNEWRDAYVVAKSKGWVADKAIFGAVMQVFGASLGAAHKLKIQDSDFLRDAAMTDIGMSMDFYLDGQPSGVVEFCSQQWRVDITGVPWTRGRTLVGNVSTNDSRILIPVEVGGDIVEVKVESQQFGLQTIEAERPMEIVPILVDVQPQAIYVDSPGEVVNVAATIEDAVDTRLSWDPGAGSWTDGQGAITAGAATRPLQTPASETDFPFLVVVESVSRDGLRVDGLPPRLDTATVHLRQGSVTVSPSYVCVANGESHQFEAIVSGFENTDVVWSLAPAEAGGSVIGSIDPSGTYRAPSTGSAAMLVYATSVESPSAYGVAELDAGFCTCEWELSIPGDGSWGGDAATHGYAAAFTVFNLSFTNDAGGGTCYALDGGPAPGELGAYQVNFVFSVGARSWVTNAEGGPATLTVESHAGHLVGRVTGNCVTIVNEQEVQRTFTLRVRSLDVESEGSCEP